MKSPKVFCIGFHKTGTTSMRSALTRLGYTVTGPNGVNDPDIAENVYGMVRGLVPRFDAFQDNPWPVLYRELDEWYPGSKFILTVRSTSEWINSQVRHFGARSTPMRHWIYGAGCPKGNERRYIERYEKHNEAVVRYFQARQCDFLELRLGTGDEWERLCDFLDTEIPAPEFPYENRSVMRR